VKYGLLGGSDYGITAICFLGWDSDGFGERKIPVFMGWIMIDWFLREMRHCFYFNLIFNTHLIVALADT
jgi:hypothetical protein